MMRCTEVKWFPDVSLGIEAGWTQGRSCERTCIFLLSRRMDTRPQRSNVCVLPDSRGSSDSIEDTFPLERLSVEEVRATQERGGPGPTTLGEHRVVQWQALIRQLLSARILQTECP